MDAHEVDDGEAPPPTPAAEATTAPDELPLKETREHYILPGSQKPQGYLCEVLDCRKKGLYKRCIKHGGGFACRVTGCTRKNGAPNRFCTKHAAGDIAGVCKLEKCDAPRVPNFHYCVEHITQVVERRRRDAALRGKHMEEVWLRQNKRCAAPLFTCVLVNDGKPTRRCPFVDDQRTGASRELPPDMAELDHIKPVYAGGGDERENLQALCACCHALKSRLENYARHKYSPTDHWHAF
jgi:hypothetical protein